MAVSISSLFKKEVEAEGGRLMAKQRRFAYVSLVPILLYMGFEVC